MFARLVLLLVIVPMVELALLMMLADWTNWKVTLAGVLITGLIGGLLIRHQGWRTMRRMRDELARGQMPRDALLDGLLIFSAGLLLLTPGVLTDLVAIALLVPASRKPIKAWLVRWIRARWTIVASSVRGGTVIDTTARRVDEP